MSTIPLPNRDNRLELMDLHFECRKLESELSALIEACENDCRSSLVPVLRYNHDMFTEYMNDALKCLLESMESPPSEKAVEDAFDRYTVALTGIRDRQLRTIKHAIIH